MRIVKVRKDALDEKEDDFYQALYTQSQAQFNTYIASGTVLNNYAHIFDILIRLRQAVDHPYLVIHSATNSNSSSELVVETSSSSSTNPKKKAKCSEKDQDCCICHDPVDELDGIKATCGHVFCKLCIEEYISTTTDKPMSDGEKSGANCPSCFKPLTLSLISESNSISIWDNTLKRRKSILDKVNLSEFQSSTKLEALMQELTHMQRDDLGAKAIVFSQFVNMLDLIEYRLQTGGISCVKLQGSMNIDQRDKVLKEFNENHQMKVLLISLKAGGVALNLTVANYIYIMDPW
jgi:DNA repair protein RAD16